MTVTTQGETEDAVLDPNVRLLLVSIDCHAGPEGVDAYRPYVESSLRSRFDEYVHAVALYDERLAEATESRRLRSGGAGTRSETWGLWDAAVRRQELDGDGIAGEVVFPQGGVPFGRYPAVGGGSIDPIEWDATSEERISGPRAYNRWLADLCSDEPARHHGVAVVPLRAGIEEAVAEVEHGAAIGLKGGVSLPPVGDLTLKYNNRAYDRLWAACQDHDAPLNLHGGAGQFYGGGPEEAGLVLAETDFLSRRTLWFLIFSGVFERFPRLRLVVTEQRAHWVVPLLEELDSIYRSRISTQLRAVLPRPPSEYFRQNCYVGGSFLSPAECDRRHEIGLEHLMWGSDYPHTEGTWPWTQDSLRRTLEGLQPDELRLIAGENAIHCYGFDKLALAAVADQVGPKLRDISNPLGEVPPDGVAQSWGFRTSIWD